MSNLQNAAISLKHIHFIEKIQPILYLRVRKSTTHLTIVMMHCWQMMANKFYTYKTDYWCSRPSNFANFSVEDWRNLSTPWKITENNNNESVFDNCKIFNVSFSTFSTRPDENTETIPCTSWEYDSIFDVSQINLNLAHRIQHPITKLWIPIFKLL